MTARRPDVPFVSGRGNSTLETLPRLTEKGRPESALNATHVGTGEEKPTRATER
jgi:hypothetical protein